MIRGIYTAASAMLAANRRQESLATDAANIQTTAYKGDRPANRAFANLLVARLGADTGAPLAPPVNVPIGAIGTGVVADAGVVDLAQGPIVQTRSPLDLALSGPGFFVVQTPGGLVLTRDGHFQLDGEGRLVTVDGYPVMSEAGGAITLGPGAVAVAADGTIYQEGRAPVRLALMNYAAADLVRVGRSSFTAAPGAEQVDGPHEVVQGALEGANVDATMLMTGMKENAGRFRAAQHVFQAVNTALERLISETARF